MEERTTIQISESLRRRLKVLASLRDVPYEDLLNSLVDVFEACIPFKSEREFAKFFEENIEKFGFKRIIERRYTSSPDYVVEDFNGKRRNVELELFAEDIKRHRPDPSEVDYVVALFSTADNIDGIPVISVLRPESVRDLVEKFSDAKHVEVPIPATLHKRISELIKDTGFHSVSEYVTFLLREIVSRREEEKVQEPLTEEDIERIRRKLKALGYL
jgi:Arc/MetJ-type ribon-helix-helix transcriptional regulator